MGGPATVERANVQQGSGLYVQEHHCAHALPQASPRGPWHTGGVLLSGVPWRWATLPTQYRASGFKDADEAGIILGAKYLENKNFQAYIQSIAEYLPSGLWHEIGHTEGDHDEGGYKAGEDASRTLTIKCGDGSPNWADPSPLDCLRYSLADVRQLGIDALEAYREQDLSMYERAIMFPTCAEVRSGVQLGLCAPGSR